MSEARALRPTLYPELNAVLQELVRRVQSVLGDTFLGAYLQGSFAVGDYDEHSDVDWIVAVKQPLAETQVNALQTMHGRLYDLESEWAKHLEGSYYPEDQLRDYNQRGVPLWYLDHGSRSLILSEHDNTAVVRWQVRESGFSLVGPHPKELVDPIPVRVLREEILENMIGWGREILAEPAKISNHFYQTFTVLHYCRALHDLHQGRCGSKRAGAAWAAANLDPAWAGLIDRAWDGRPDPARSVRRPADPEDVESTLAFAQYVVGLAQDYAADGGLNR